MSQSQEIYSATEFNNFNLEYYTVSAQIQRKEEEQQMNELMDFYKPEIDLDDILVSTEEYLNLQKTK